MARENHVDRQVKEAVIYDTIHLVDPLPFDRFGCDFLVSRQIPQIPMFFFAGHTVGSFRHGHLYTAISSDVYPPLIVAYIDARCRSGGVCWYGYDAVANCTNASLTGYHR